MDQENDYKTILKFAGIFIVIFLASFLVFSISGLAPKSLSLKDYIFPEKPPVIIDPASYAYDYYENYPDEYTRPDKIVIPKIGVNTIITQPNTRDVATLDQYLTQGAVHYPGSGSIESGNIFLFGHSTGLQVVQNQAFKAFNGLNKLVSGDMIELYADGQKYLYKVLSVELVSEDEALVRFDTSSRMLTISTCNTFGQKQERYVVKAVAI